MRMLVLALSFGVAVSALGQSFAPAELTYSVTPSAVAYTHGTQNEVSLRITARNDTPHTIPAPVIRFLLSVGCAPGNLVSGSDVSRVVAAAPPGWTIQSDGAGTFQVNPPPLTLQQGDHFSFTISRVIVNDQAGLTAISIFEGDLPRSAEARVTKVANVAGDPPPRRLIVPLAGSAEGAFGSAFRTSMQLLNTTNEAIAGTLLFHPAGVAGTSGDVVMPYALAPRAMRQFDDFARDIGAGEFGTVDVRPTTGSAPRVLARIFSPSAGGGTAGLLLPAFRTSDALVAGEHGFLTAPSSSLESRFNVAIRTLGDGLTIRATLRNAAGADVVTVTRSYSADDLEQTTAADFVGAAISGNDSMDIEIVQGSGFVCGSWIDNVSQDASIQCATR